MPPRLERLDSSSESAEFCTLLERDGAVIVENILSTDQLRNLNGELDRHIEGLAPGLRHPSHEEMIEFYGHSTTRFDGLPAKSETFCDIMLKPHLTETANHFLLPNCEDYLLNTGQLIQIGPGETAQMLHRDEDAWKELPAPRPPLQIEAMFALTDFTLANGATRVAPGSHRWPLEREATPDEITQAEMAAGSALLYLGSALHGGGANTTTDESRRGMFLGYVVGWLRTEENMFLTVPMEQARTMPVRIQELLGYKAHRGIGVADVGDPMVFLS
ncbi:MAG: phytanoyl-CoA dioxygenase family protein [Rhodospirillales bacterium]|nr:phytanoyl-CoA dioxygenase family protein [Rhodospirillales bacterium]